MGANGASSWIIVALAPLWLGIAAWIALIAARRFRLAQQVLDAARANARLLELAPARPLLVRPDQRIEADPQLLRDIGLHAAPARLSDLSQAEAGITAESLEALTSPIE